jgi:hypothetical protein
MASLYFKALIFNKPDHLSLNPFVKVRNRNLDNRLRRSPDNVVTKPRFHHLNDFV